MVAETAEMHISPYGIVNAESWHEMGRMKRSPYEFKSLRIPNGKPADNILCTIGATPLVKLNRIPQSYGIKCNVYAKLDYISCGGASTDRIAKRMVEIAEECGELKPGMTIIEPTSGNMAISVAMVAALNVLNTMGAKTFLARNDVSYDSPNSHFSLARELHKSMGNTIILCEKFLAGIPIAHYESTGSEILHALDNKVDVFVSCLDTGGTIAGIGGRIKEKCPNAKVVGVELQSSHDNCDEIEILEQIGNDFGPTLFDLGIVDQWVRPSPTDALRMAKRLSSEEALLGGYSSSAAILAAMEVCHGLDTGKNCVVLLDDEIRNFMTTIASDEWMIRCRLKEKDTRAPLEPKPEHRYGSYIEYPIEADRAYYTWSVLNPSENNFPMKFKMWSYAPNRAAGETAKSVKDFEIPMRFDDVLGTIGNTPLVKLNKIPQSMGVKCNVYIGFTKLSNEARRGVTSPAGFRISLEHDGDKYIKCDYLSPGGSIKDRVALRMVQLAEEQGKLRSGMTIIEPTSGNTGIGLAMVAAARGHRCIIAMPQKMSREKADILNAFGAEVVRTPTELPTSSPDSHVGVAMRLRDEIEGAIIMDQFQNLSNPLAHYENTAEEILYALDDEVDMFVAGTGTGGTVSGTAHKLKEICPNCIVIAADPEGSILANPSDRSQIKGYEVEGIGDDFVPLTLDSRIVDVWQKVGDFESFEMARRLIKEEGILCGGSSGTNLCAALKHAVNLNEDQNCVVIICDGIRNYLSKFMDDGWMQQHNFMQQSANHPDELRDVTRK